jgi:hypothetical protein
MNDLNLDTTVDDQRLLAQIVQYYSNTLKANADALEYLKKRGIHNQHVIDAFKIGFADRSLGLQLPPRQHKHGAALRDRLQHIGLFRESGHEHFRGSITFPIPAADNSGRIVDVYGRKMLGLNLRPGTEMHTHLNDKKEGVWNIAAFGPVDEIVLCPGLWDALTFWSHGYQNVTCMFGQDALTPDLLAAFAEFKIQRVITSSQAVVPKLLSVGLEVFVFQLPPRTDVNSFARRMIDPADALGGLLRGAGWEGRGATARVEVPFVPVEQVPVAETLPDVARIEEPPVAKEEEPKDVDEATDDVPVNLDDMEVEETDEEVPVNLDDVDEDDDDEGLSRLLNVEDEDSVIDRENDEPEHLVAGEPEPATIPIRTASPVPAAPQEAEAQVGENELTISFGNRRYRVRGFQNNSTFDVLRINVLVTNTTGMHVDTFDLYSHRHRKTFQETVAAELHVEEAVIRKDLGRVLLKLEEVQDKHMQTLLTPQDTAVEVSPEEREAALRLLRDPRLLARIVEDVQIVGEDTNKIMGYLAASSRKLDQPLAIIVQSTSAAGKTTVMEAVLAMMPPEDVVKFSAMTGQSLFYMGQDSLQHKILAIVEEEGAQRASYALKLLQSEGELRIASTGKEGVSGRLTTQEYRVEGPTMLFLTTTSIQVDEELLNRCVVLTVDEDREQTRAIHQLQRRRQTLEGMVAAQAQRAVLTLHRNAQRLLKPLMVVNPVAEVLTFADAQTRTRRDHAKYLTLIRTIALLHQCQRPVRNARVSGQNVEYIEVTLDDIATANRLAHEVLGRSLDELPPQTRRLLDLLDGMATKALREQSIDRADYRFSRRDVRTFTGWGDTQLKVHLGRLVELEYLLVHRGDRGRSFVYELQFQQPARVGGKVLAGLIDVEQLRHERSAQEAQRSGPQGQRSGVGRPVVAPLSAPGREEEVTGNADPVERNGQDRRDEDRMVYRDPFLAFAS